MACYPQMLEDPTNGTGQPYKEVGLVLSALVCFCVMQTVPSQGHKLQHIILKYSMNRQQFDSSP